MRIRIGDARLKPEANHNQLVLRRIDCLLNRDKLDFSR